MHVFLLLLHLLTLYLLMLFHLIILLIDLSIVYIQFFGYSNAIFNFIASK